MSLRSITGPLELVDAVTFTGSGNYTVTNESAVVVRKASGAATTVVLPPLQPNGPARAVWVVDGKGDAATNNITVDGNAAETVNGSATFVLSVNYAAALFVSNGSEWNVVSGYQAGSAGGALSVVSLTASALTLNGPETAPPGASTAAAGSTVADAGALPAGTSSVYPTTAANGTKGVVLNAADQVTGRTVFVGNGVSNQTLKVYGPSGAVINGAAADAAFVTASGKGAILYCLSGVGNTWLAW